MRICICYINQHTYTNTKRSQSGLHLQNGPDPSIFAFAYAQGFFLYICIL